MTLEWICHCKFGDGGGLSFVCVCVFAFLRACVGRVEHKLLLVLFDEKRRSDETPSSLRRDKKTYSLSLSSEKKITRHTSISFFTSLLCLGSARFFLRLN